MAHSKYGLNGKEIAINNSNSENALGIITGIKGTVNSETYLTSTVSTKYATRYNNQTESFKCNSKIYTVGKVGDATKEVNQGGRIKKTDESNYGVNWYTDLHCVLSAGGSLTARGGKYNDNSIAGIFYSYCGSGSPYFASGFRTTLIP